MGIIIVPRSAVASNEIGFKICTNAIYINVGIVAVLMRALVGWFVPERSNNTSLHFDKMSGTGRVFERTQMAHLLPYC